MSDDPIDLLSERIRRCHRLALGIYDPQTTKDLLLVAESYEEELERLRAERSRPRQAR